MLQKSITWLSLAAVLSLASCRKTATQASVSPEEAIPTPASEPAVVLPAQVSFNEHIQPILSEYCYHCHGPDAKTREPKKSPLRLDLGEDAFKARENGKPVILKGNPKDSLIMKLIHSADPDSIMPPPESHKTLGKTEIALLEKWIEQGAEYQPHWSFGPVIRPTVPQTATPHANPIDSFIDAKLAAKGLKMNPPEDPRRFHRRLTLDLTGLPPAPAATDAFVKRYQENPDKAVTEEADALFNTPAHAEHLARYWLDAARYADTHGIHIDNYRSIWPYRDWVIQAFRQNMPWDQFTIEQIAGDLLPNRTLDQQVATGFNRCLATTGEGGAIAEEYDAIYAKDRVETTAGVWLGLTAGCAACHDHKFDPISQRDFYSFAAFFRNTPMSALDGNNANHPPNVMVPLAEDRPRWNQLPTELKQKEQQLAQRREAAKTEFAKWQETTKPDTSIVSEQALDLHLPLDEADGPIVGKVAGQPREWAVVPNRINDAAGRGTVVSTTPIPLGDLGSFKRTDQVSFGAFVRVEGKPNGAIIARMDPAAAFRGWDIYLQGGKPASHVIDTWPSAANKINGPAELEPGKWQHVMVTFDGSKPATQTLILYVNGVAQKAELNPNTLGPQTETPVQLQLGSRNNNDSKLNGIVAIRDFRFYRRLLTPAEVSSISNEAATRQILSIPVAQRTKAQNDQLFEYYLRTADAPTRELTQTIAALRQEQETLRARGAISLVMEEKPGEPFAYILNRGVYSAKTDKVPANIPAALPALPADAPKNRLGLARWLVSTTNPLTPRVTVNRAWYQLFGTGIVETTEDFGIMGARPSHPQLLDWLAAEFLDSKWDYRHMLRLMVTSQAYRQSSQITPEKLEKDPLNRLLSRGPRVRLDAEQIRDLALSASDLLSTKVGGPSVKPYQPEGIWEAVAMKESNTRFYKQDQSDALYRRSLYTFWKRTAAPPSMEILNAPTREVFCVRRERTNTPLQALVVLNDPQFVEASRQLAANAMQKSSNFDERAQYIAARLLDRPLQAKELTVIKSGFDSILASFTAKPDDASQLLKVGATAAPNLPAPELAAWTLVASQILNLDENLTR